MKKFFNIAGPCNDTKHYMIPVIEKYKELLFLIKQEQYFVIHAARQTGKTTLIKALVNKINSEDDYYALYCSLESVHAFKDPEKGMVEIVNTIKDALKYSNLPNKNKFAEDVDISKTSILISSSLTDFSVLLDKPFIIFFDEIDGIEDGTLITFLRQLRKGYVSRPEIPFVHSIALVGMRDIRDYKSKLRDGRNTLGSKSPFNIIKKTFTLENFSFEEVISLYKQHTEVTKQIFEKSAVEYIYQQSKGQPWLVNAIATKIIEDLLKNDHSKPITKQLAKEAIQNIIKQRHTHIDSLLDRLKDERVRKIIEPILITTNENDIDFFNDDLQYCKDLGLIKEENKILKPSNPIYAEVIIRELSYSTQARLQTEIKNTWIDNNKINMNGLMEAFQEFWRENSTIWTKKYQYQEAAPHLIMQAFLQRIINGGGDILREYSYGKKRIDLCVRFGGNKYPIELKLHYGKKTIPDGLEQLAEYMDGFGEKIGWLVVFDRRKNKTWDEKIYWKTENYNNKIINIVGC